MATLPSWLKTFALVLAIAPVCTGFQQAASGADDLARWERQARGITIVRDDWGIAHISGRTDADAVFGMIYAQAEDDFNRVETNYLNSLGRLAEAEGESKVILDLRQKLFMDPVVLKEQYTASPAWLRTLMDSWADGLNYFLARHPTVKPRVITRFEPWMALSFTEGSIGGDIERINLGQLEAFYSKTTTANSGQPMNDLASYEEGRWLREPTGSNGMAVARSNTKGHHALLLINPHTSFFFRSELQMTSGEGLNAYGAVTWGQFFIYQGFNEKAGWMHTSSGVDAVDEYLETVEKQGDRYVYKFGGEMRPVQTAQIKVPYRAASGTLAEKTFTVYRTQHGPIIRESNGKWVAIRLMQVPIAALTQSYTRTKATNYKTFRQTMELKANSSNNTIFADSEGNIAYFHGNYIPRRDTKFDWTQPVEGSDPATEYKGLLDVDETPQLLNPGVGWLYNTNNWPWSAAGPDSPKKEKYPAYVESGIESARGRHAIRVLENKKDFTIDSLIAAAYDSYLPWFEKPIPALLTAWDTAPDADPVKLAVADQIAQLRKWDLRWGTGSVPTSLAVFWGEELRQKLSGEARRSGVALEDYVGTAGSVPGAVLLQALLAASNRLHAEFGKWQTPWGEINRFQRLTADLVQPFNDAAPSIPVGFTSAQWGSLASFGARPYPGTKRWYGTSGNSFVAVVEFGPKVRAKAVTAGGESGSSASRHFNDQAARYSTGSLREVYFYPAQLKGHTERTYRPGE